MCWLIHYVISGKGTYFVGNNTFEVHAGQAFIIKPGEVTTYTADENEPWEYVWAGLDIDSDTLSGIPYVIDDIEIGRLFTEIYNRFDFSAENQPFAIARMWEIYGRLLNMAHPEGNNSYIRDALNIIKKQYMQDITIQSIADQLGLDRSYFSNLFKKHTGITPMHFIIRYRMQKALTLLNCNKYSISVIATSVGYSDLFSFSRSFKKFYGVPPQKYKEIPPAKLSYSV